MTSSTSLQVSVGGGQRATLALADVAESSTVLTIFEISRNGSFPLEKVTGKVEKLKRFEGRAKQHAPTPFFQMYY